MPSAYSWLGAEMAQHVRRQPGCPVRQVRTGGLGQGVADPVIAEPAAAAVTAAALGGKQRRSGPGVVGSEVPPHVLDEPPQGPVRTVDERDHPLARARAARSLAVADVPLAEPAQLPLHVRQVQAAGLVHPQPCLGHQPGRRVVPRGRGEFPAGRQVGPPPGEQDRDLPGRRRDPQRGLATAAGPVHRVDRAPGHVAGQLVDLGRVPQLQELEAGLQRLRPAAAGVRRRAAQRRAEVGIGVRGLHLPQRPAEPVPDQPQVRDIRPDRRVGQPGRRPGEHELGQHAGLEIRDLLRAGRRTRLP
jgi:hypothetical protein